MNKNLQFSLVVPCYNVAPYVRACLDSVAAQTCADGWEAICVDDGATDGTGAILDAYAAKDPRFKVIHQPNAGVSAARNAGLEAATGEWLWFIDSDDSIAPFALAYLARALREHPADVFRFGYQCVSSQTAAFPSDERLVYDCDLTKDLDVRRIYEDGQFMGGCDLLWNACFRRSSIGEVRFLIDIQPGEDNIFALQVLARSRMFAATQTTLYNYFQRPGSCMMRRRLKTTRSAVVSFGIRQTVLRDWTIGFAAIPRTSYFKWLRNMMYVFLCEIREFPRCERKQLFAKFCDVGVSVFDDFPFYQRLFRAHCFAIALMFLYLPMKVRIFLLKFKFVSWLKKKIRGA